MKLRNQLVLTLAVVGLAGCTKQETPPSTPQATTNAPSAAADTMKQEVKEAAAATGAYLAESRDKFVAATQESLKDMDAKIESLSQKAATLAGDAKSQAESMLTALREKRQQASVELEKVKAASQEAWTEVKAGCNTALEEMKEAYNNLVAKLG